MQIEYEATFLNIDKDEIRQKLGLTGALLLKSEYLQRRIVFNLPEGHQIKGGFLRVRDESDKITMSLKIMGGGGIADQRELCLDINDFDGGVEFLDTIGCQKKAYQETKRELWILDDVEITIDEWPFLEPFIEIEGKSEEAVKTVSHALGFDYSEALFCGADTLYNLKYGVPCEVINNEIKEISFNIKNPFID